METSAFVATDGVFTDLLTAATSSQTFIHIYKSVRKFTINSGSEHSPSPFWQKVFAIRWFPWKSNNVKLLDNVCFGPHFAALCYVIYWLIGFLRRIGNISAMYRRRLLVKCDQFWKFWGKNINSKLRNITNNFLKNMDVYITYHFHIDDPCKMVDIRIR